MTKKRWILLGSLLFLVVALVVFGVSFWQGKCFHWVENGSCKYCGKRASRGLEFTYDHDTESYIFTGLGRCRTRTVILPDTYLGKPVTKIAEFHGDDRLRRLHIPPTVNDIPYGTFQDCSSLEAVYLQNVSMLSSGLFSDCPSLKELYFTNSVRGIREDAIKNCPKLVRIDIKYRSDSSVCPLDFSESFLKETGIYDWMEKKGKETYYIGRNLAAVAPDCKELIVKAGTVYISPSALADHTTLEKAVIPGSVEALYDGTFAGCMSLREVTIGEGFKNIQNAFSGCKSLETVDLPDSVTEIGDNVFDGCISLQKIRFPKELWQIGENAFRNCESLESVEFSEGLLNIERSAFQGCRSLKRVALPDSLQFIGENAFAACQIKNIVIPKNVKDLGSLHGYIIGDMDRIFFKRQKPWTWKEEWNAVYGDAALYWAEEWEYVDGEPVPMA